MRLLDGIIESMDMSLSKLQETGKDRDVWFAAVHGIAKSWTWPSDWTTTWIYHTVFIHSPADGYLDYFQLLSIMTNATLDICM